MHTNALALARPAPTPVSRARLTETHRHRRAAYKVIPPEIAACDKRIPTVVKNAAPRFWRANRWKRSLR